MSPAPGLFLIAHKVRGEAAFDVATPIEIDGEPGWIIPTSGHRAYPYWTAPLDPPPAAPPDARDHYTTSTTASSKAEGRDLLATLGLGRPQPIRRL